jgi:hypothetical protein
MIDRLAPVHVRERDVDDREIDAVGLGLVDGGGRGVGTQDLELIVERELFGERVPQILVVVDDEKPARVRHRKLLRALVVADWAPAAGKEWP